MSTLIRDRVDNVSGGAIGCDMTERLKEVRISTSRQTENPRQKLYLANYSEWRNRFLNK